MTDYFLLYSYLKLTFFLNGKAEVAQLVEQSPRKG